MDLLFERFLSEERGEWPDIDLDLPSGDRRERVIQHVYEKYGQHGAAMTANVITYRGRSAAREVGKALGIEPAQIDRLAKVMHTLRVQGRGRDAGDAPRRGRPRRVAPAHAAVRGAVAADPGPAAPSRPALGRDGDLPGAPRRVVPLENASMPGRVVVQWDKDDCADMGIVKIDLLGLGMMAVLQDALGADQPAAAARRAAARAVEPAARRPRRLPDAAGGRHDRRLPGGVARADGDAAAPQARALLRPRRRGGDHPARADRRADGAPVPEPARGSRAGACTRTRRSSRSSTRTLGVPLFQEQLLRIAMMAAGFTGGQAEELRRAFGFKRSRAADEADRGAAARGDGAPGHHRARRPTRSSCRSRRSRCTGFPSRTRRASRCSSTRART